MSNFSQDWAFLDTSLSEIKPYLLSKELFWPLGGSQSRLTLGNLLAHKRISANNDATNQAKLQNWEFALNAEKSHWHTAWIKKGLREFTSRLRQWENFLAECQQDRHAQTGYYQYEVRLRVILELLRQELDGEETTHVAALLQTDLYLKSIFSPGAFIWAEHLKAVFPVEPYWYLHGSI